MVATTTNDPLVEPTRFTSLQIAKALALSAVVLTLLQYAGLLPGWLHRLPEAWVPPFAIWLDAAFTFARTDLGLEKLTRWFAEGPLQFMLDTTANLLYGKKRWPRFEQIPWSAIAASAAVLGYYLGGWRLAALAGGTFVWTALIGQWKIAMETMSVLVVAPNSDDQSDQGLSDRTGHYGPERPARLEELVRSDPGRAQGRDIASDAVDPDRPLR